MRVFQVFAGLLVGAMLPYWFSSMTMKSVGKAALAMVEEVRQQFNTIAGLMEGTARPDYKRCVEISTKVPIPLSSTGSCASDIFLAFCHPLSLCRPMMHGDRFCDTKSSRH